MVDKSLSPKISRTPFRVAVLGCLVLLLVAFTISVSWGAVAIPFTDVWAILIRKILHLESMSNLDPTHIDIVWTLRAPRVVLAAMVGSGLSLAGVAAQAMVRNPLADPYVLGVSAGASVAAVASILFGLGAFGLTSTSSSAFAGAVLAMLLVILFGQRRGVIAPLRLILAGVAIGHLLAGITSFLVLQADDAQQVFGVLFWLEGSLARSNWNFLLLPVVAILASWVTLFADGHKLNALLVGDETASSLGVNVNYLRGRLLIITALLTAVMVSLSGIIGFVGLVVPHIARLLVGSDHRRVIPVAAIFGAAFLILADAIARLLLAPIEIPVGIVTGIFGAPFFLWLLWRAENLVRV